MSGAAAAAPASPRPRARALGRLLLLGLIGTLALQLFFLARIALMVAVDPQSTTFQRSEAWRIVGAQGRLPWSQQWQPYEQISDSLKRAVIASEDSNFLDHGGVEWEAIEKAWARNARAEELAARRAQAAEERAARRNAPAPVLRGPKIFGGSTITQQLAKNLLLSGERTLLRKGQELVLAHMLELLLPKARILEIYLNNVEWGEGVFGAEAAAQHYFRKPAARLSAVEAARLAVMLPRPKYFEQRPGSGYVAARARTIAARMGDVQLP